MTIEELLSRIGDLENRIVTLENDRSADSMHNKLTFYAQILEDHSLKLTQHDNQFKAQDGDINCVEQFTDADMRKWYSASGLFVKDVQTRMQQFLDKEVSSEEAHLFLTGKISDPKLRSQMGKWFRTCAVKHNTERNI